jgi:group I intron endonuclease
LYGYIYLTTNLVNGKQYIGRHKSETFDEDYKGSGILIHKAFDKYGKENFKSEILCECSNNAELNEKEKYYIESFNAIRDSKFYNIAHGGQGGDLNSGRKRSEEFKRKISAANTGKTRSEEWCKQQSEFMKGNKLYLCVNPENRKWSEEQTRIMSEKHTGKGNPMYGKHSWNRGIPMSDEAKARSAKTRRERGIPSSIKGKKALHKDGKTIYVFPDEVDDYISRGYNLHGAKRNRSKTEEN